MEKNPTLNKIAKQQPQQQQQKTKKKTMLLNNLFSLCLEFSLFLGNFVLFLEEAIKH